MNRAEYEERIIIKGFYDTNKCEDRFTTYVNRLKGLEKKIDKCEFIGIGINKYYAMPVFYIDGRIFLLWNSTVKENDTELYFVKPFDFEICDWQDYKEFLDSHIN